MIFVSVGTHPQPFERLVKEIALLVDEGKIKEKVIMQTGSTIFTHPKIETHNFLSISVFEKNVEKCSLFITHAGEGNIGTGIRNQKPMIVVPRIKKMGEHTDDHQLELAESAEKNNYGTVIYNISTMGNAIDTIQRMKKNERKNFVEAKSFFPQILNRIVKEEKISNSVSFNKKEFKKPKSASIVVATLNGGEPLIKAVNGMLQQDFKGKYEVIVVDDGSFDTVTPELLKKNFSKNKKVKLVFLSRSGVCKARNAGINASQYDTIINMDHDCIPEKNWLGVMVSGFNSPEVGAVSAYGHFGGTSTGFRKDILHHLDGYDEDYFYYREDTDLSFRIMELGFIYNKVNGAKYREDRTLVKPKGIKKLLKYTIQRLNYHKNDVLLHKKHKTKLCNAFLHVKGKFFINPVEDFKVATGIWENEQKEFALSSPRGITFLKNETIIHFLVIIISGLAYAFAIKWARLAGSIKHGHFLM